jgi:endonuclease/exonuclease/phosphatase family metal-dependent hydrolase
MLRVATFNIRHGERPDGRVDHGALVETCAALDADVVGLQEVDDRRRRSAFHNQAALVARRLGYAVVYGTVVRVGRFARYGNALLARGNIHDVEIVQLLRPSPRQRRGAILARVDLGTLDVSVAVTHLQHHPARLRDQPAEAPLQLRALLEVMTRLPRPRILLGDLNLDAPRALPLLAAAGYHSAPEAPTFPVGQPRLTLDYVAVQGLRIVESEVVPSRTSDHCAVVAGVESDPIT